MLWKQNKFISRQTQKLRIFENYTQNLTRMNIVSDKSEIVWSRLLTAVPMHIIQTANAYKEFVLFSVRARRVVRTPSLMVLSSTWETMQPNVSILGPLKNIENWKI